MQPRGDEFEIKQGISLTIAAVLVALFSFAKEAVFASYFGVSEMTDAYMVAIQIPEIVFAVVWESINAVVIPLYTKKRVEEGDAAGRRFVSNLLGALSLGIVAFVGFGEAFAGAFVSIFAPGLSIDAHALAVEILRCVLPMLLFEAAIRIAEGILSVHRKFVAAKILNITRSFVPAVFIVLFARRFGVLAAALGVVFGYLIECVFVLLYTRKFETIIPAFDLHDRTLRQAGKMAVPVLISVGIGDINQVLDKIVASFLSAGSISALGYATKLNNIIRRVVLSNIITLVYPKFSQYAAENEKEKTAKLFSKTIEYMLLLSLPIIAGACLLSKEIVTVAFARGAFDAASIRLVSVLFCCYIAGSGFGVASIAGNKLFTAFLDTRTPMRIAVVGLLVNAVLNIVLSQIWGAPGLAIATTVSNFTICLCTIAAVHKKVTRIPFKQIFWLLCKAAFSAGVMCVAVAAVRACFADTAAYTSKGILALVLLLCAAVGAVIYYISLYLLRVEAARSILIAARDAVRKRRAGGALRGPTKGNEQ